MMQNTIDHAAEPAIHPGTTFDAFYDTSQPQGRKGRAWIFEHFRKACDTPGANRVQAVLVASNTTGFALYARQNRCLHPITHNDHLVRFRTIEQALDTLSDVSWLAPEIAIDTTGW
ncbi:hypothetical protein [Paraburkholderia hayleyella]|uniref:hypothetical protein n=1 Tax=Paraburkholderia hayleyella TaxID=2152889 RepID=UPI0012918AA6|nr:hypothetical protein [Paraburkholderia hayleyella]